MRRSAERGDGGEPGSARGQGPGYRTSGRRDAETQRAAVNDLLQIRDLRVRFASPGGFIEAVKGISFRMAPGSTVALVGESGSGKSVVSQSIMRILPRNGEITRGQILFADPRRDNAVVDLAKLPSD